jgi:hypothetical protein
MLCSALSWLIVEHDPVLIAPVYVKRFVVVAADPMWVLWVTILVDLRELDFVDRRTSRARVCVSFRLQAIRMEKLNEGR